MSRSARASLYVVVGLTAAALVYAGGYALARSQGWIVHFAGCDPTNVVAGHALWQGQANVEGVGVYAEVPDEIAGTPLGDAWIAGWMYSHRLYTPLMWIEECVWEVLVPSGSPWRY